MRPSTSSGCIEELRCIEGQVARDQAKAGRKLTAHKAKAGRIGRRQKLKRLEREAPHNPHLAAERSARTDFRGAGLSGRPWPEASAWHGITANLTPSRAHPVGLWRRASQPTYAGEGEGYLFRDVPAERRSSQASTTRFAMPASANFPQARGSYAFLLPTSPSTFSTPS